MKKLISVLLATFFVLSLFVPVFAADTKELKFNEDGTFKIMQINDTQDVGKNAKKKMLDFIGKAIDAEQPDLVVLVGDQLSEYYFVADTEDMTLAIEKLLAVIEEKNVPFLMTLGNHDYDNIEEFSVAQQRAVYSSFENCYAPDDGADEFTYNVPVMSSDSEKVSLNIYMMDTHNKAETGGYAGVNKEQVEWYKETSALLKAENNDEAVPSMLFQHTPPKEIYTLLVETDSSDMSAIYSGADKKWYRLIDTAEGFLGEAPCSENFDNITGQYEAWLECGDIIGAFFAHDHVNSFMGTNADGITMGYNAGTGFRSYGLGSDRSVRIFEFNEDDVENYETRLVTYADITGDDSLFVITDKVCVLLLTPIMRIVDFFFGWLMA